MINTVITPILPNNMIDGNTRIFVNPTGRFVIGVPASDSGLTSRKIIVDTYGGYSWHGGGAFSGKYPTKVDHSSAYVARWVAKNIVAVGLAKKCEVQIAYGIGVVRPVSVMIESFGTSKYSNEKIEKAVLKTFDLCLATIIRELDLKKTIYKRTAAYGHMGRNDLCVKWEQTNKADDFKKII